MKPRVPIAVRFWKYVNKTESCWLWTGGVTSTGYGSLKLDTPQTGSISVHKFSWQLHNGPVPAGMLVCHDCPGGDNRLCVRPSHLFLGTYKINMQDAVRKGRLPYGEAVPGHSLTDSEVVEIQRLYFVEKFTKSQIARRFEVWPGTITDILEGRSWKHLHNAFLK